MTDQPVIQASLVDTRNVGTDKELKIELRIPAEMATKFFDIFGWPTRVSPVPVALARLDLEAAQEPVSEDAFERMEKARETVAKAKANERAAFKKLSRVKQAGILCNKPEFQKYLKERFQNSWAKESPEGAAAIVRWHCIVTTRADLDKIEISASRWDALEADFYAKSHGMR